MNRCYLCQCEIVGHYIVHGFSPAHISCALMKPEVKVAKHEYKDVKSVLAACKKQKTENQINLINGCSGNEDNFS